MVRTAMKAVLLSPVVVLVLWSVAAVVFSHKQLNSRSNMTQQFPRQQSPPRRSSGSSNNQKKGWFGGNRNRRTSQQLQYQPQGAPLIVQPAYLPKQGGTGIVAPGAQGSPQYYYPSFPEQGSAAAAEESAVPPIGSSSARYYYAASGRRAVPVRLSKQGSAQLYYALPEQGAESPAQFPAQGTPPQEYITFPEQGAAAENPAVLLSPVQRGASRQYYTLPKRGAGAENPIQLPAQGTTQQYYTYPEQDEAADIPVVPLRAQGSAPQYYPFPEQGETLAENPAEPLSAQGEPQVYYGSLPEQGVDAAEPRVGVAYTNEEMENGQQPLAQEQPVENIQVQQPLAGRAQPAHANLRHKKEHVKYYYYDPKAAKKDKHGNMHLPKFVYDAFGRAVSLKALSQATPVFMEAPSTTMTHQNASTYNATYYNYTHTHPPVVESRQKRKMSMPDYYSTWTDSTAADSSIIVCTVGVMALLVGALSARRMRSRSILSACIENEALLEDEAAYDTAYTVNSVGAANHYNTFQQGWKGDLEKFDV